MNEKRNTLHGVGYCQLKPVELLCPLGRRQLQDKKTRTLTTLPLMDGSESMSCSPEPGKGTEAEAVVVTATATPSPVSELSPAALPASSSSVEATAKPPSPALPPTPTPVPPRCLGARGYDGGFYDVGSFFVFRHEPQQQQRAARDETPASAEEACGGDIVELFGAGPAVPGTAAAVVRSPLQFELLDGLAVRCAAAMGGKDEVNGSGPETAARAFVVLQRQVRLLCNRISLVWGSDTDRYLHARFRYTPVPSYTLSPSFTRQTL